MVKISALFLMVFLLIGTLGFVVAEEESEDVIPEAKKVGFFENSFDNMRLAFTFNKEKKIEMALDMAEKKLAEAEATAEENPERAEKAQEKYDALVAKAEEIMANIEETKDGVNGSADDLSKMARIQNKFENHREHIDMIYTRAMNRFEENNASDEKIARFEGLYEDAMNRTDGMEAKLLEKKENAVKKHKVLANMSDEELEELLVSIDEKEGLMEAREQRQERAMNSLDDANLTDEQRARISERVEAAEQKMAEHGNKSIEGAKSAIEAELAKRQGQ